MNTIPQNSNPGMAGQYLKLLQMRFYWVPERGEDGRFSFRRSKLKYNLSTRDIIEFFGSIDAARDASIGMGDFEDRVQENFETEIRRDEEFESHLNEFEKVELEDKNAEDKYHAAKKELDVIRNEISTLRRIRDRSPEMRERLTLLNEKVEEKKRDFKDSTSMLREKQDLFQKTKRKLEGFYTRYWREFLDKIEAENRDIFTNAYRRFVRIDPENQELKKLIAWCVIELNNFKATNPNSSYYITKVGSAFFEVSFCFDRETSRTCKGFSSFSIGGDPFNLSGLLGRSTLIKAGIFPIYDFNEIKAYIFPVIVFDYLKQDFGSRIPQITGQKTESSRSIGERLEKEVTEFLKSLGFSVKEHVGVQLPGNVQKEVDLVALKQGKELWIECKNWKTPVDLETVQSFYSLLSTAERPPKLSIIIVKSASERAKSFASANGVLLLERDDWKNALSNLRI
jgi:Holliday junction resolvase